MAKQPKPRPPREDLRIDHVGLIGELVRQYVEGDQGLKARIKATLRKGDRVLGQLFEGLLVEQRNRTVSPSAVLRLFESKQITRSELLGMLSVTAGVAEKVLPGATFRKLVKFGPPVRKLTVERKEGVEIALVDVLKQLATLEPL